MQDNDDPLADDDEEILVYVEFDGSVASNMFSNEKLTLNMIGLDTDHPIMQVNGKYYEGTYHDVVGTYMFFEKDNNPPVDDPVFDAIPMLKYCAKTRKLLKMQRIFVEPKTEMLGDSNDPDCIPNMETIVRAGIPPKYQEAALKSWETMRNDRMEALNKYLEKQRIREEKRAQGIEPDSESDDDNPFAMYLPESKRKTRKEPIVIHENKATVTEQNTQPLTVIDPGPSTSKNSQPWSSPKEIPADNKSSSDSDENEYRANPPKGTGKHRATVKVMRKGKIRKHSKCTRTKPNKKEKQTHKSSDSNEDYIDDPPLINENEELVDTPETLPNTSGTSTNAELKSTDVDASNTEEESESINDKRKIEKQQKRDEKMRLLAERLKKAAEEVRMKANRQMDEVSDMT